MEIFLSTKNHCVALPDVMRHARRPNSENLTEERERSNERADRFTQQP